MYDPKGTRHMLAGWVHPCECENAKWFVCGIIKFKISLWCSRHTGLSVGVYHVRDAIFTTSCVEHVHKPKYEKQCFLGKKFNNKKKWKLHCLCIHTCLFICITAHLFRFTCIHYLHTNATLHAISRWICGLSSPAWTNKQGEEEVARNKLQNMANFSMTSLIWD